MKWALMIAGLLAGSQQAFCQFDNIWKNKPWEKVKHLKLGYGVPTADPTNSASHPPGVVHFSLTLQQWQVPGSATSLCTAKGYNMPCLLPAADIVTPMPVLAAAPVPGKGYPAR